MIGEPAVSSKDPVRRLSRARFIELRRQQRRAGRDRFRRDAGWLPLAARLTVYRRDDLRTASMWRRSLGAVRHRVCLVLGNYPTYRCC